MGGCMYRISCMTVSLLVKDYYIEVKSLTTTYLHSFPLSSVYNLLSFSIASGAKSDPN